MYTVPACPTRFSQVCVQLPAYADNVALPAFAYRCCSGGAENASTGKRNYGKGKYETAHFAMMENACTVNASTMQTFSQIKKVWYFTS